MAQEKIRIGANISSGAGMAQELPNGAEIANGAAACTPDNGRQGLLSLHYR